MLLISSPTFAKPSEMGCVQTSLSFHLCFVLHAVQIQMFGNLQRIEAIFTSEGGVECIGFWKLRQDYRLPQDAAGCGTLRIPKTSEDPCHIFQTKQTTLSLHVYTSFDLAVRDRDPTNKERPYKICSIMLFLYMLALFGKTKEIVVLNVCAGCDNFDH